MKTLLIIILLATAACSKEEIKPDNINSEFKRIKDITNAKADSARANQDTIIIIKL